VKILIRTHPANQDDISKQQANCLLKILAKLGGCLFLKSLWVSPQVEKRMDLTSSYDGKRLLVTRFL
jgi:hypothetical protein